MSRQTGLNLPGVPKSVNRNVTGEERHPSMRFPDFMPGLAAACFMAAASAPLSAQSIPSAYRFVDSRQEAGLFAGSSSMSKGRFGFGPAGGFYTGGRWGIELSGPLGFETVAGVISGTRDIVNPAKVVGDQRIGEADAAVVTADARLRFTLTGDRTWHGFAPFIVTGGGIAVGLGGSDPLEEEELAADDRFDFGTSFFGTAGGGARFVLTDRLALRGDAIFSLWKIGTPPGFSDPDRGFASVEESEWVRGLHLTLSVVIRY
ncbi:MAG: hypothetical protein Q8N53_14095 [Longimicrobiales bacterium]|nr:hypothetical protein [Longimicrobiales bacterium]